MSNLSTSKDSQPMILYKLASHCKAIGPIISELQALLSRAGTGAENWH